MKAEGHKRVEPSSDTDGWQLLKTPDVEDLLIWGFCVCSLWSPGRMFCWAAGISLRLGRQLCTRRKQLLRKPSQSTQPGITWPHGIQTEKVERKQVRIHDCGSPVESAALPQLVFIQELELQTVLCGLSTPPSGVRQWLPGFPTPGWFLLEAPQIKVLPLSPCVLKV